MNQSFLLRLGSVVLRVLSWSNLVAGLLLLFYVVVFSVVGKAMGSWGTGGEGWPKELPTPEMVSQVFLSWSSRFTFVGTAVCFFFLFVIYRGFAEIAEAVRQGKSVSSDMVSKLRKVAKYFVALFTVSGASLLFDLRFEVLLSKVTQMQHTFLGNPPDAVQATSWKRELGEFLFPDFAGGSGLVMALLICLLAKFLEDRIKLQEEIHGLKEESNLTI